MMARVRAVTAARMRWGSRVRVSGSTSTSTGRAPTYVMAQQVAMKVWAVVITSSPGPTPQARSARWSAAVPELAGDADAFVTPAV